MLRRRVSSWRHPVVSFDGGRSRIQADLATALGLGIYRRGFWCPELSLLVSLLRPGDVFIDGGANVGLFALVAASRVGPSGRVIAFEPASRTRAALGRNVALNSYAWVTIRRQALGRSDEIREMVTFSGDAAGLSSFAPGLGGGSVERVPVTTLDRVHMEEGEPRVSLIKLDLEGAEHDAIMGARSLLRHSRPRIILEVEDQHLRRQGRSATGLLRLLREQGYELLSVHASAREPGFRLAPLAGEEAPSTVNVLAQPTL